MHVALNVLIVVALVAAYGAQMLRWLRVLQREHYEASAISRFVARWSSPQVSTVPKAKVRVAQLDVGVRTATRDNFEGASRFEQDRLRSRPDRVERRPFTASHVLIFAFILALFAKDE